ILGEIERVADRAAILLEGRLLGVHGVRAGGVGRRLRLRVRGGEDAVHACLARVPGVQQVRVDREFGTDLAAYLVDAETAAVAEALAAAVVAAGFGLLDMGPAPVDLEALFLGLTGGRPEAPACGTSARSFSRRKGRSSPPPSPTRRWRSTCSSWATSSRRFSS